MSNIHHMTRPIDPRIADVETPLAMIEGLLSGILIIAADEDLEPIHSASLNAMAGSALREIEETKRILYGERDE